MGKIFKAEFFLIFLVTPLVITSLILHDGSMLVQEDPLSENAKEHIKTVVSKNLRM